MGHDYLAAWWFIAKRHLIHLGYFDLAEDAVNDGAIKFLRAVDGGRIQDPPNSLNLFLIMCVQCAKDRWRREASLRRRTCSPVPDSSKDESADPIDTIPAPIRLDDCVLGHVLSERLRGFFALVDARVNRNLMNALHELAQAECGVDLANRYSFIVSVVWGNRDLAPGERELYIAQIAGKLCRNRNAVHAAFNRLRKIWKEVEAEVFGEYPALNPSGLSPPFSAFSKVSAVVPLPVPCADAIPTQSHSSRAARSRDLTRRSIWLCAGAVRPRCRDRTRGGRVTCCTPHTRPAPAPGRRAWPLGTPRWPYCTLDRRGFRCY